MCCVELQMEVEFPNHEPRYVLGVFWFEIVHGSVLVECKVLQKIRFVLGKTGNKSWLIAKYVTLKSTH